MSRVAAGSSQVTSSTREGDLKLQIKMLREELTSAQESAAAATGHAKQYETLAKSSDEAVKAMQVRNPTRRHLTFLRCFPDKDPAPSLKLSTFWLEGGIAQPLQAQLEKGKAEYEERISAVRNEAEELQAQLSDTEKAKAELQRQLIAAQKQAEDQRQQAMQLEARMQVRGAVWCCRLGPADLHNEQVK